MKILLVMVAASGSSAQAYNVVCTKIYASSWNNSTGAILRNLYELNGATLTSVFTAPQALGGLAISANGSAYYDNGTFASPPLYRYNGTTQTNTGLTVPNLNVGEAADSAGNVYYIDTAYHLRKAAAGSSGTATDLGALIFNAGDTIGPTLQYGDMTFDGNGRLMWYSSVNAGQGASYLYYIDPLTLKAKSLGQVGPNGATGLAFDSSGNLITTTATATGTKVISVNLGSSSLAGTTVGTANTPVYDLGSCATPILNAALNVVKTAANITKGTNPATIAEPGDVLEYTITTTNTGNLPSTDSTLTDSIPTGTTYVAGSTTLNGTAVADVAGAMPYSTSKEIYTASQPSGVILATASNAAVVKFRVKVNASNFPLNITNTATSNFPTVSAGVSTTQSVTGSTSTPIPANLSITKTDGVNSVNAGGTTTYTIRVTNSGPSTVTDALLKDPAITGLNITGVTCSTTPGACTTTPNTVPTVAQLQAGYALPSLSSGAFYEIKVTGTVTATSGAIANIASVTSSVVRTDGTTNNQSATDTDTVTPVADLSVTKTDGVTTVTNGQTVTYTIRVSNAGPSSVTGATLSDPVASGLNVTGVTCSTTPGTCTTAPTTAQLQAGYALPTIASGGFYEIKVTGTITATLGDIANTVTVTVPTGTTDPTPDNNSVTDTDTINAAPAMTATKAVNNAFVKVTGDPNNTTTNPLLTSQLNPAQLMYTVTVKNTGNVALSNVQVTDTLQSGLTYVAGTTTGASEPTVAGQQLTFSIPSLAVGASQTITFKVDVSMNANTSESPYLNSATATSGTTSAPSNQVRTDVVYTKLIKRVRNLTHPYTPDEWSTTTGTGLPGDVLEYCIDARNYGSIDLNNYVITDNVPVNTTYVANSVTLNGLSTGTSTSAVMVDTNGDGTPDTATTQVSASVGTLAKNTTASMCFQATIK